MSDNIEIAELRNLCDDIRNETLAGDAQALLDMVSQAVRILLKYKIAELESM